MEGFFVDILGLLLRWLHMIAGIAWIGASFYFVMLDRSLQAPQRPADAKRGVAGELWAVHGGGFYHSQKLPTGPKGEPLAADLHWSKWEAYTTWLTGIGLLGLIYWYGADLYLIDPQVMALDRAQAIGISIGFLTGGWLIYDGVCRSALAKNDRLLGGILFALTALAAWGLCQIYSGRGAYLMFGAVLGTCMAANVFFVIIPGQKQMVAQIRAGRAVDPKPGLRGKQRSVHNTYFTLPVLFTMISHHYAITYGHAYNWLILIGIALSGALIRVFFVSRHGAGRPAYAAAAVAVLSMLAVAWVMLPKITAVAVPQAITDTEILAIVTQRCSGCHSARPDPALGFPAAPQGVAYDSLSDITAQADMIYQQSAVSRTMPLGNLTGMTEDERRQIEAWYLSR